MPHERRHFVRVEFDAPAQLTSAHATLSVNVLDLSLKGALLQTSLPNALPASTICQLTIPLSAQAHIAMNVQVMHSQGHTLGLRCNNIDLDSVTHLRRLIELQLGDPALLERDLSELMATA